MYDYTQHGTWLANDTELWLRYAPPRYNEEQYLLVSPLSGI